MNDATTLSFGDARPWWADEAETFFAVSRSASLGLAIKLTGSVVTGEDALQNAQLRAFRAWESLESDDRRAAWFRRILIRCATDAIVPPSATAPEMFETPDLARDYAVRAALEQLSEEHRVVLSLSVGEGLSYREISETLQIPMGTVGSRVNAAKTAFKKAWGEEL